MHDKLIINNNDDEHDNIMKEIKKMSYIKNLNLSFSIIRFILMFYFIFLLPYMPASLSINLFTLILAFLVILILPLITIFLLGIIISGNINRDFWFKKNPNDNCCSTYFCCCCLMSKNVTWLKVLSIYWGIIELCWSFINLYFSIKDFSRPISSKFFPYSHNRIIKKIILHFIDSFLLFGHSYFFYYTQYFLSRLEKYLEYYKRLIIKNRNKEAEFVRNILPAEIHKYIDTEGKELQNV